MEEYFERFLKMIEVLEAMPYIQLINFELFEPVSMHEIAAVEGSLGFPLDSSIKDFYRISNGLQLKWIHKKNPKFSPDQHCHQNEGFDFLEPLEWYNSEDACINILPLRITFLEQNWGDIVWSYRDEGQSIEFSGNTYDLMFLMQRMKPLDIFSKSNAMVFFIENDISNPKMLLSQEHFADIESSRITSFSFYLEFILHTWGLIVEREQFYSVYGGHNMPLLATPTDYWQENSRPNLEEFYAN